MGKSLSDFIFGHAKSGGSIVQTPTLIEGSFGRAFIEEYKKRREEDFGTFYFPPALQTLTVKEGVVTNFNYVSAILASKILKEQRLSIAGPHDLQGIYASTFDKKCISVPWAKLF